MTIRRHALSALSTATVALPIALFATNAFAVPYGKAGSILARVDNEYVSASNSSTSLISNAAVPGATEVFHVVDVGNGYVALYSPSNDTYVCAENSGNDALIANRSAVGPWETFTWIDLGAGEFALQSEANGLYVTAENAGGSALIANRPAIGPWETFHWVAADQKTCPAGSQLYGDWAGGFCCNGTLLAGASSCNGALCALDPAQAQGYPLCYQLNSPTCLEVGSHHLYGGLVGGFCCDGSLSDDKNNCNGNICALDPNQSQGAPLCTPITAECPPFTERYGEWAGGFCCEGTVLGEGSSCDGNICALDPNQSQGNPLCDTFIAGAGGISNGLEYFTTNALTGTPLRIFADPAGVIYSPGGASISGTITIESGSDVPPVVLANASLDLAFDVNGYVSTLIGTATVSLPTSDALEGLDVNDLGQVTVGLDWGVNLKDPQSPHHIAAPMQDDRQYLVYSVSAGLSASLGAMQFSAPGGVSTLIVVDPRDPSFYFRGDLSGLTGLSALDDVGIGLSAQGLLPFEHNYKWGIENFAQDFDGNLILEGGVSVPGLPLTLDGQMVARMPTTAEPSTHLGINGALTLDVDFCPGVTFALPIGEGSASFHLDETAQDGYFSGRVFANVGPIFPTNLPITLNGEMKAAGRLSSNLSDSFLKLSGTATVDGHGLEQATLQFDQNGVAMSGMINLPGFKANVAGTAGPNAASLSGTVNVHIPIVAPKVITDVVNQTVYYTANGAVCGWSTITSGATCGWSTVTSASICGWTSVTSGATCGWSVVASWFCQTFGCAPVAQTCDVAATCTIANTCTIENSCSRIEPYTSSYTDQNYHYGDYYGTVTFNVATGSGVTGSLSGSYCPAGGWCTPPAGARVEDLGGANPKACATILDLGEFCVDL